MHSFRLFFFGAPYNGVYKFSAVFYPGVELETKVYCSPNEVGGLGHFHRQFDQLKRPGPHNFGKQALSSLIICF